MARRLLNRPLMLTSLLVLSLFAAVPSDAPLAETLPHRWTPSAALLAPPALSFGKRHQFALRACAMTGALVAMIGAAELIAYAFIGFGEGLSGFGAVAFLAGGPPGWLLAGKYVANHPRPARDDTAKHVLLGTGIAALIAGSVAGVGCGVVSAH